MGRTSPSSLLCSQACCWIKKKKMVKICSNIIGTKNFLDLHVANRKSNNNFWHREIERHRERFLLFNWKHVLDLSFLSILGLKRDIEIRERDRKGLPPHIKMQNLTHDLLLGPVHCSCLILASVVLYISREQIESNTWIANNHHFRHYKKKQAIWTV